jgi:hypothetical protein
MPGKVTEGELTALAYVMARVRVPLGGGRVVGCVPVEPELRDRLIETIRTQRAMIRRLRKEAKL